MAAHYGPSVLTRHMAEATNNSMAIRKTKRTEEDDAGRTVPAGGKKKRAALGAITNQGAGLYHQQVRAVSHLYM